MNAFEALLRDRAEITPRPCHEAQIQELTLRSAAYSIPCPFNVGDLVTPRSGANSGNAGEPHIVIAVRHDADFDFNARIDPGACQYGCKRDIRVLVLVDGEDYVPFWEESAKYIPYSAT